MSGTNLCSTTANYVTDSKANVQKEIQALQQTAFNLKAQENGGISCVYNSDAPAGKTILITNNYSHNNGNAVNPLSAHNANLSPKSSITIYTHNSDSESVTNVSASSINILINNHFDHPVGNPSANIAADKDVAMIKMPRIKSSGSAIDSITTINIKKSDDDDDKVAASGNRAGISETTIRHAISVHDDVLIKSQNDRFYLGTVIEVGSDKCFIKFDDNTMRWSHFDDITKLRSTNDSNSPICVVCKESSDSNKNVIYQCEQCCRGYHKKCAEGSFKMSDAWYCKRCVDERRKHAKSILNPSMNEKQETNKAGKGRRTVKRSSANQLAYDLNALTWDEYHQQNIEQIYCYCGQKGKWFMQMLQCCRCHQWFHAECVKCLTHPLYFGDRFYLFACSACNHGAEFLRRLHISIEDLVHLLLFNLTLQHSKAYFNLVNVILPYTRDNWHALQLPPKLKNMLGNDVKEEITKALKTQTDRFEAGPDVDKKVVSWALKNFLPPVASNIALPPGPPLTEKYINDLFYDQARIYFLPQNIHNASETVANDAKMRNLMSGKNYASLIENCDIHSYNSDSESSESVSLSASDSEQLTVWLLGDTQRQQKTNAVASSSLDMTASSNIGPNNENNFTGFENNSATEMKTRSREKSSSNGGSQNGIEVEKIVRKRGRPPSNPKPEFVAEFCDSSDDGSSRGTLDSIIPVPKDFTGINNPFLSESSSNSFTNEAITKSNSSNIGLASTIVTTANGNSGYDKNHVRIVRTVKRRLSAKDIMIGPNQEIKRRKLKKRSAGEVEVISTSTIMELPKSASYLPIRSDSKDISIAAIRSKLNGATIPALLRSRSTGDMSNTVNGDKNGICRGRIGRRLRQRSDKNDSDTKQLKYDSDATALSKAVPHASASKFLKPLNGMVAKKIENGEKIVILAKRITRDGTLQYLVE